MTRVETADRPTIRQATPDDFPGISLMQQTWEQEQITHGQTATDMAGLRDQLNEYFLVAELEGQLVGMVAASVHVSEGMAVIPAGERYLAINDLYVCSAWRAQGIGRRLLDAVLARAEAQGLQYQLVYSATKDLRRIMRFYESCGFESWYVQLYRRTPRKA
ncbi:MAG TPA: GNAT family N-acetyltransferase [Armatimonadota bacterium]|nr:GNAT family N-acetyltransferase [Armatimonadota bacterium]